MDLCSKRKSYQPTIPDLLQNLEELTFVGEEATTAVADHDAVKALFPHLYGSPLKHAKLSKKQSHASLKVGVVLSGGQAAGGHNVITAIFDALEEMHADSELIGFLEGPAGVIEGKYKFLDKKAIDYYRNQGGFDLIGSGRDKIETEEQLHKAFQVIQNLQLNGLVVIGGDDSNTNAAVLAEYLKKHQSHATIVGVPKTIDGDLKNEIVEVSFGFDTATKTYSELIGNIARDALSAKKYYHFIKLMGRSASHVALECAMYTHPNYTFISEEVKEKEIPLKLLVAELCDMICKRAEKGKNYGLVLIPEGLIEFIPEIKQLIKELNESLSLEDTFNEDSLSKEAQATYKMLPSEIQKQLIMDRDPHGNVQVSHIQTEKLFIALVKEELKKRSYYKGSFNPVEHFFGYEGRSGLPTNFDATYCYALGRFATSLIAHKLSGYMSAITQLNKPYKEWKAVALPIPALLNMEMRKGKEKPVIKKALVELNSEFFQEFATKRANWQIEDNYQFPGPIQFFGDALITDAIPLSIRFKKEIC